MTIRVYPSVLPGEPLEHHEADGITIERWLIDTVPEYERRDEPPITVAINGKLVDPARWPDTVIRDYDDVEIRPQPKGGGAILAAVVGAVVAVAATMLLKPSIPSQRNRKSAQGRDIEPANAEANTARPGSIIPEIAGRYKRFPDYLSQARRRFSGPKEQQLDMLLCVGRGEFDIEYDSISVGNTPAQDIGSSVSFQIFEPGEDVSGHRAHENWYNAPEVGSTVGGSGLKLRSTRDLEQEWAANDLALSGSTITGSDQPVGWGEGTTVLVSFSIPVTVAEDGNGVNTFEMSIGYLKPTVGMELRIDGISGITLARIKAINGDVYHLERAVYVPPQEGAPGYTDWQTIDYIPAGSYTAGVYDWPEYSIACRVTGVSSGLDVVMQRNGSDVAGWPGFPAETSSVSVDINEAQLVGIWTNAFAACPAGETTDRIEFDVFAPQGLGYVKDNGDIEERSRTIELRYRPAGSGGSWTTISKSISGRTRDQLGWTWQVPLSSAMRPEVQVRRVSAEDNDVQSMDALEWYGLRSKLPAKTSYPGITVLAVTITGSDTIASQTENRVSLIATRKLPILEFPGKTWSAPQPTRAISSWVAHIATSAGYGYEDLDIDELARLDGVWHSRGDYFDFIEAGESTVKESLNRCLRAGMAELTIDGGKLRPVRDEPRSTFEQMYTPQNMLQPLERSVEAPRPDDPDGVDVEYVDADTWSEEVVECRLPGDAGVRAEKVTLEGVTDRTRAWRIGMRRRRELKYRRWAYSFSTELDALNSSYMSYCALGDDVPGYGQSAWLKAAAPESGGYALLVSEPMEWQEGASHVVAWRRPDGTLAGPFPAARGDDDYEVIATVSGEPMPTDGMDEQQEPAHILFGASERWSYPVLIQEITPQGFERVNVKAVNYDARVYADDDNSPP